MKTKETVNKIIAKFSLALAVAALCAQGLLPVAQAGGTPPPSGNFHRASYEQAIRAAFGYNKVMGYSTALIKDGKIVAEVAGGSARNAADGYAAMTVNTPANIGSTIKFTGGVTLLHLFESKSKWINPSGRSVDDWLDLEIYFYFPKVWQDGMHPSIKKITFRHLLQHRSGFPDNVAGDDLGNDGKKRMFDYLAKGVSDENFGKWNYANANVSLITYLIPMIADPTLRNTVNLEAAKNKWTAEGLPIHKRIADAWEQYMHSQIYSKITPAIKPSCNPTVEFVNQKRIWAPDYKSATDAGKGATRDSRVNSGYCQAQGGWYISSRELATFVNNFDSTNTLVSVQTREMMFGNPSKKEMLVWSFTISDPVITENYGDKYKALPYMGGDHGGAHASILLLPNGYYAIGIINSDDMGSSGVTKGLLEAFKAGFLSSSKDNRCLELKTEIEEVQSNIADWKADLSEASPSQKAALGANIKAAQTKLASLKAEALKLGCTGA